MSPGNRKRPAANRALSDIATARNNEIVGLDHLDRPDAEPVRRSDVNALVTLVMVTRTVPWWVRFPKTELEYCAALLLWYPCVRAVYDASDELVGFSGIQLTRRRTA